MIYNLKGTRIKKLYAPKGSPLEYAYDINGELIWSGHPHNISESYTVSEAFAITSGTYSSGMQGFAVDNLSQQIAQCYGSKIVTIDIATGEYIPRSTNISTGHGSAAQFALQKTDPSDLYPLLYVSHGSNITADGERCGQLIEIHIDESSCFVNRVFYIPIDTATYGQTAIDFENNILYHATREKYEPDSGETIAYTYFYAYDMTQYMQISAPDGAISARNGHYKFTRRVDKFTVPFISEMQSVAYFDGMVACLSDVKGVVFVDVKLHEVYMTLKVFQREREGIGFVYNSQTHQTDMIVSARISGSGTHFNRYEFDLSVYD